MITLKYKVEYTLELLYKFQGLWDQILALQWVKQNISFFGGDPNDVTVVGEGSGAVCVSYHLVSKKSGGLFHKYG